MNQLGHMQPSDYVRRLKQRFWIITSLYHLAQVLFSSCSLFPLLGRSLVCHVLNCHWQADLAVVKRNRLNCHLGEFTVSTHCARTNWSGSEKKEKKKTEKICITFVLWFIKLSSPTFSLNVLQHEPNTPKKWNIKREKKSQNTSFKKHVLFTLKGTSLSIHLILVLTNTADYV